MDTLNIYNSKIRNKDDNSELNNAIEKLNFHMRNKNHFKPYVFSIHNKEILTDDYSTKNLRLSYYINCELTNCNFFEASFAGSIFVNTQFIDCNFDCGKFQSCTFRNCDFIFTCVDKREIKSVNFSKAYFYQCRFENIFLNSANLEEAIFSRSEIIENKWHSVSLENAVIKDSTLKNMRFSSQNFDFMTIINIKTYDVVFPFPAMPYVFNGLKYIYDTKDDIRFTSCGNGIHRISKSEYISLMEDFVIYYKGTDNFFPLSNILIAQDKLDIALHYIECGIIQSIRTRNFRMILNYCKLLKTNFVFTIQHRKKIYNLLLQELNKEELSSIDFEILSIYIDKIKSTLIEANNEPYITLDIKTNIDSRETKKIVLFLMEIENLITLFLGKNEEHHTELRHNSDMNFIFQIAADPERLIIFLAALFQCIHYSGDAIKLLYNKASSIIKKIKNSEKAVYPEKENDTIIKNFKDYIRIDQTNNVFINNNIVINEINYYIFNTQDLDSNIQSLYLVNENINKKSIPFK